MQRLTLTTLTLSLLLAGLLLGGCSKLPSLDRGKQERTALWQQNQELQNELDASRRALDAGQGDRAALQAQIDDLERRMAGLNSRPQPQPMQPMQIEPDPMDDMGFTGIEGIETSRRSTGEMQVRMDSVVLFQPGKADLSTSARDTLKQVAAVIRRDHSEADITVEGHTDKTPIKHSKWASNQKLSEARAAAVAAYLTSQGIAENRLSAVGYGEDRPLESDAKSRRVEIVIGG